MRDCIHCNASISDYRTLLNHLRLAIEECQWQIIQVEEAYKK